MNIYLVCKHKIWMSTVGSGVHKECIVLKPFSNKQVALRVVKDLNSRSKKYWYSVKKLVVTI